MKTVHKYPLFAPANIIDLALPVGAKILHCGYQAVTDTWSAWAEVDTKVEATSVRHIRMAGTGHPLGGRPMTLQFINTAISHDGQLVFHFYEILG